MPQLDFSTYASQIFWLFITFGMLYIAMARFALPNVREVLENRRSRIINDLTKAEKLKKEAESAQAGFASSLSKAHEKAHSILQDLHKNLAKKTQEAHAKLDASFEAKKEESEKRQALLRSEATLQMEKVSAEVAQHMLKKLINIDIDLPTLQKISADISKT